jgi:hypothetical protein
MDILKTPIDIKTLIQTSTIDIYDKTKLVEKLKETFSEDEQRLYVCNLFLFLNYHPINDFIINLENVWKFIGFSNKANAKRLLKHNFTENIDYKITLIRWDERKNEGGYNQETIMLNINTFKKLCLKANTENADKIHDYYIKLEMIYNELMKEEFDEQKKEIENQKLLLEQEKENTIKLIEEKDKLIQDLENKPETEGFNSREPGEIYCIIDTTKPGHLKIGIANKSITRVDQLNVGSSTHSLKLYTKFETFDRNLSEKLIHHSLHPFRIKNRKEWFYFRNDIELAYAINIIKTSLQYIKQFDIKSYTHFKESTLNLNVNNELIKPEIVEQMQTEHNKKIQNHIDNIKKTNKKNVEQSGPQTGTFKGVSWDNYHNQWLAQLQHNYKNNFLGYFEHEIDAARTYNDYALFLNQTENTNFYINDIQGYVTKPRNVLEENKNKTNEKKSSKYIGVSYDSKRKFYISSIKCCGKTYNLGSNENEIECAKLYNQQALFFNNTLNTKYILNNIDNYITTPHDFREEIKPKKSSKYYGVSITRTNKWAASYMLNRKKIHIGTFNTELEACEAYNKIVIELNKNGCNYKIN